MIKKSSLLAAAGIVLTLTACGGGNDNANEGGGAATESSAAKAIYEKNCASCHGENLEGGIGPSLKAIGSKLSKEEILAQIKNGGGGMPGGLISGEKADKVAEWLASKK
ncbi:MAG TPA: cytochrome c [Bacillales bacterium]|nr:cytochrome c [Bacillales bacterium]